MIAAWLGYAGAFARPMRMTIAAANGADARPYLGQAGRSGPGLIDCTLAAELKGEEHTLRRRGAWQRGSSGCRLILADKSFRLALMVPTNKTPFVEL